MTYDLIIIGTGAMGSATLAEAARRGWKLLGIDRFVPPHNHGSSHGESRIIREAYYEHPDYVPLLQQAYRKWAALEQASGMPLFRQTGGLLIGAADSSLIAGARHSAEHHRLPYQVLGPEDIQDRFPAFHPGKEMVGIFENRAGILLPENCISAFLQQAHQYGAHTAFGETVLHWEAGTAGCEVITDKGRYAARQLLFCAGAWLNELLPLSAFPISVERQVLYWFRPQQDAALFHPSRFPVFLWAHRGDEIFYGFPDLGKGVKVARHYSGEITQPGLLNRNVNGNETGNMQHLLRTHIPAAAGELMDTAVCMYSNTIDRHFRIGLYPGSDRVWLASICSGHGFKFASVMGSVLADLMQGRDPAFDLSLFAIKS